MLSLPVTPPPMRRLFMILASVASTSGNEVSGISMEEQIQHPDNLPDSHLGHTATSETNNINGFSMMQVYPMGGLKDYQILEREEFLEQTQRLLLMGTEHVDMLEASSSATSVFPLDCENYDLNGYENLCYLKEEIVLSDSTSFEEE